MRQPNGHSNMDHSNFVIVKARLGSEVRKVAMQNFDITRDELLLMLQRIFKGQLSPNDKIGLKYRDEDNDYITIADDQDLSFAISCHKTLVLAVTVNGVPPPSSEALETEKLKAELMAIRDSTNRLLDSLSVAKAEAPPALNGLPDQTEPEPQPKPLKADAPVGEFDPLQAQQQQQQQAPPRPPQVPTTPTASVPPAKDSSQPPSVYGMGHEVPRSDTPSSQASNRTGGEAKLDASLNSSAGLPPPVAQPDGNVATITPTLHQQVNAPGSVAPGPVAPPNAFNGMPAVPPAVTGFQPTSLPTPTPPPPVSAAFGSPAPPPPQPGGYPPPPPPSAALAEVGRVAGGRLGVLSE